MCALRRLSQIIFCLSIHVAPSVDNPQGSRRTNGGAIAGGLVVAVLVLLLVALAVIGVVWIVLRKRDKKQTYGMFE